MVSIDKQEQVRAMVNSMKDKVNKYEAKLKMQKQNSQQLGMLGMAITVVELSREGYTIRKFFGYKSTEVK